jgi:hypothetical protein
MDILSFLYDLQNQKRMRSLEEILTKDFIIELPAFDLVEATNKITNNLIYPRKTHRVICYNDTLSHYECCLDCPYNLPIKYHYAGSLHHCHVCLPCFSCSEFLFDLNNTCHYVYHPCKSDLKEKILKPTDNTICLNEFLFLSRKNDLGQCDEKCNQNEYIPRGIKHSLLRRYEIQRLWGTSTFYISWFPVEVMMDVLDL